MRARFVLLFLVLTPFAAQTQNPKALMYQCFTKFSQLYDFKSDVVIQFDVPRVNIQQTKGKLFYKKPNKFRIKLMGIAFLPKQNPFESINNLSDTNNYIAVKVGEEIIEQKKMDIINIIPTNNSDLITGKFWVNKIESIIYQYELTTRSSGTMFVQQLFSTQKKFGLPDQILFSFDVAKFKVPKGVALDINSKKKSEQDTRKTGTIKMIFTNIATNIKVKDEEFVDAPAKK